MSEVSITSQYRYTGKGPMDKKLEPVATKTNLNKIPRTQRYVGMTVTVLDEMADYWLSGDTMNSCWVKKTVGGGGGSSSLSGDNKTIKIVDEKISLNIADKEHNAIQASGTTDGIYILMQVEDEDF